MHFHKNTTLKRMFVEGVYMFAENFSNILKEKNITAYQVAKNTNISQGLIGAYKSGKKIPGSKNAKKIADYLNVSVDYLLGSEKDEIEKHFDAQKLQPQVILPVVGIVSAGKGVFADEEILGHAPADIKYGKNNEYYWLKVHGDSMYPRIADGDLVLIKRQTSIDPGDIGVFLVDEEDGFIKKVNYSENYIVLQSLNPFYPPMEFRGADVQRVRVLGKAIELKAKF